MPLTFPASAEVVFERPPLLVVLTQVRFPPILTLLAEPGVAGFQEAIRDAYPSLIKVEEAGLLLGPNVVQAQRQAPVWKFTTEDEQWILSLSVDFVALESLAYANADDFLDRFDRVLDALDRTIHPAPTTRVGLRKVNDLVADVHDARGWRGLLNPWLLGIIDDDDLPGDLAASFSIVRLKDENGDELLIQHGVQDEPSKNYRIDLDYFTERPFEVKRGADLRALLRAYAESETQFFMWSIGDELRSRYGPMARPINEGAQ